MANSVDPNQTAPIGAVCSGSMLFASILNSSVMLGNYLQLTTSADNIFRCIFFFELYKLSLSKPFWPATNVPYFRTFIVFSNVTLLLYNTCFLTIIFRDTESLTKSTLPNDPLPSVFSFKKWTFSVYWLPTV